MAKKKKFIFWYGPENSGRYEIKAHTADQARALGEKKWRAEHSWPTNVQIEKEL